MVRNVLRKSYSILYLMIFLWITLQATIVSYSHVGIVLIITLPLLALVWGGVFHIIYLKEKTPGWFFRAWIVLQIISCIVTALFMYFLEMRLHWDWRGIIHPAYVYVTEGYFPEIEYINYARYPNNKFWLSCMVIFFKFIHHIIPTLSERAMKWCSMIMTAILAQISLTLIWQTARMWMDEVQAFFIGCIAIFYLPFYLYAGYSYTDTPSMFLSSLLLFLNSVIIRKKMTNKQQATLLLLFGMVLGCGFRLKVLVIIQAIALLIELFLSERVITETDITMLISPKLTFVRRVLSIGLVLLAFIPSYLACERISNHYLYISNEQANRYELPLTHWIMMGLYKRGGYDESILAYSESFPSYEEKREGIAKKMDEMVNEMGPYGFMTHVFVDKLRFTWADSIMRGDWFCTRKPLRKNILWNIMDIRGKYHTVAWEYTCPYWLLMLVGMILSAWYDVIVKPYNDYLNLFSICRLSLLGLFLFLSIWEANARYAYCFMPVLVFVSGQGWCAAYKSTIKDTRSI